MGDELKGRVSLDLSPFERAALKGQQVAKKFGLSVESSLGVGAFKGMVAGALSVAGVTSAITSLLAKADSIDALSKRFSISAEAIQAIQFAADQSGTSSDAMFMGLKKLTVALEEAKGGSKEYIKALGGLGVSLADIKSKNAEQLFYQIGQRINGTSAEAVKLTDGIKVFGRAGDQVLGSMRDGFTKVADAARQTGRVIKEDIVRELADAKDAWEDLKQQAVVKGAGALSFTGGVGKRVLSAIDIGFNTGKRYKRKGMSDPGWDEADLLASSLENIIEDSLGGIFYRTLGALTVEPGGRFSVRNAKSKVGTNQANNTPLIETARPQSISFSAPNLTGNQQVGAYSAMNPFLNRQIAIEQAILDLQKKAVVAQEQTARNTGVLASRPSEETF